MLLLAKLSALRWTKKTALLNVIVYAIWIIQVVKRVNITCCEWFRVIKAIVINSAYHSAPSGIRHGSLWPQGPFNFVWYSPISCFNLMTCSTQPNNSEMSPSLQGLHITRLVIHQTHTSFSTLAYWNIDWLCDSTMCHLLFVDLRASFFIFLLSSYWYFVIGHGW